MNKIFELKPWLFTFFAMPLFMAPLSTAGSSIAGALFVLLYLVSGYWRNWRLIGERPWFWPLIGIFALNLLGMLWTEDSSRGLEILGRTALLIFALAGATLPWDLRYFRRLVLWFLMGLALNAVVGLLQWLHFFPWRPMDPLLGPIGYANWIFLSMSLANALLWLAYDFRHQLVLPRMWNIALGAVFFIQLLSTGGRTGQLAFAVLFPIAVVMLYPGRWRLAAFGLAILAVAGLGLSPNVQHRLQEGMGDLKQYEAGNVSTSWGQRLVFWEGALRLADEHPVLGVGTGDYMREMDRLQKQHLVPQTPGVAYIDNPHNTYLAYLADLGAVGLLVLLWFLLAVFRESWRHRQQPAAWFKLCYLGIFLLGSLTDTLMWGHDNVFALALIAGIPAILPTSET
ncbi:MAG: O-antigen ligase family protein [Pseudomonadota bacterium]